MAFQAVLGAALAHDMLDPTDMTASYLSAITGTPLTMADIDEQLLTSEAFIDDPLWCAHTAKDLGLDELRLEAPPGAKAIQVRLGVSGIGPGTVARRLNPPASHSSMALPPKDGIALYAKDHSWRIVFVSGQPIGYIPQPGADPEDSPFPVSWNAIETLTPKTACSTNLSPSGRLTEAQSTEH